MGNVALYMLLAMKKEGTIGSVVPGKMLMFDGNMEGRDALSIDANTSLVKISDEPFDLSKVKLHATFAQGAMNIFSELKDDIWMRNDDMLGLNAQCIVLTSNEIRDENGNVLGTLGTVQPGTPIVVSCFEDKDVDGLSFRKGTYVLYHFFVPGGENPFKVFISKIEVPEKVNPINPKFLPEGGFGYSDVKEYSASIKLAELSSPIVKITEDMVDIWGVTGVKISVVAPDGQIFSPELSFEVVVSEGIVMGILGDGLAILMSLSDAEASMVGVFGAGTYLLVQDVDEEWLQFEEFRINFACEAAHKIERKYIPEIDGVLPVFDVPGSVYNAIKVQDFVGCRLPDGFSSVLNREVANKRPIILSFINEYISNSAYSTYGTVLAQYDTGLHSTAYQGNTMPGYVFTVLGKTYKLNHEEAQGFWELIEVVVNY